MYCRNSRDVLDWGNKPRKGVMVKTTAMQLLQTCESSSSTHLLRNTFQEKTITEPCTELFPQECPSSCSRHPSSPLFTLYRGDNIHTQTKMSWTSPEHIYCLLSLAVTLEGTLFDSPQGRNSREETLVRLDTREFHSLKLLAVLDVSIFKKRI